MLLTVRITLYTILLPLPFSFIPPSCPSLSLSYPPVSLIPHLPPYLPPYLSTTCQEKVPRLTSAVSHNEHFSLFLSSSLSFNRSDLCDAIVTASKVQDKSSALLVSQASSLLSSYSSHEVISDSAKAACSRALRSVALLSREGYLAGSSENSQVLINLLSEFVMTSTTSQRRQLSQSRVSSLTSAVSDYLIHSYPLPPSQCQLHYLALPFFTPCMHS
jgi:hypothetical protein